MCGFGVLFGPTRNADDWPSAMARVAQIQSHRGPNGAHQIVSHLPHSMSLGICHQRLAVLDLSSRARQPMVSPSGRQALCFNGAIYNYRELAIELGLSIDCGEGDTWVLMHALLRWGDQAMARLNGMWSFAWWDMDSQRLLLSRDRMGEKPLYWSAVGGRLAIASEVKGVLALIQQRLALDVNSVARHLSQSLANTDLRTMFAGIQAFPSGHFAWVDLTSPVQDIQPTAYWTRPTLGRDQASVATDSCELVAELRRLLIDSVRLRMRSDVPSGLLLSGGLDSTALLGAAAAGQFQLKVVAAISRDPKSNEAYWIDQASRHFGVVPALVMIDRDPLGMWHELADASWFNDQPLAGFGAVAHRRLMSAAHDQGLTVLLSGQGSDEQLGGYNKFLYFYVQELLSRGEITSACKLLWKCFANGTVLPEFRLSEAKRYLPGWLRQLSAGSMILGVALKSAQLVDTGGSVGYGAREARDIASLSLPMLLQSEDRSSMSHGREMRLPFLDHRIVDLLATVGPRDKFKDGWPKWPLRQAMRELLPTSITWRRDKKGFNIPEERWLGMEFRPLIDEMLSKPMRCIDLGFVDATAFRNQYLRFVGGHSAASYKDILNVITLEVWLGQYESCIAS